MPRIRPFRGWRYRLDAGDPSTLLAPPYDVIDEEARARLAEASEHNCVHLILPQGEGASKYAAARARFDEMCSRALVREDAPAIYVYHQDFEFEGVPTTRRGFIALVELTPFGEGPVLPHERTLAGPKADRLALMRACDAHLELVFGLFSDPERRWERELGSLDAPTLDCEFDGVRHRLWPVSAADSLERLCAFIEPAKVYMADGHHRYETMCAFARERVAAGGDPERSRYGMIFLSNLDDPGLVVRPTHRVVHGLAALDLEGALASLSPYFELSRQPLPPDAQSLGATLRELGAERASFGLCVPGSGELLCLRVRAEFSAAAPGLGELAEALRELDVVLLHELVLERALGITKEAQAAKRNLRYLKSFDAALACARSAEGDAQLVCFMNATPVSDVVAVCDSGEVMPQKSTFFHPKIPTGLVFHRLTDDA